MFKQKQSFSYKNKYKKVSYSLKEKLGFTAIVLIVIQLLSVIPLYGFNREILSSWMESSMESIGFFSLFAGTSFQNMSIFALGIAPYITSSIIIQLLRVVIPRLDEICKDGQYGKEKTDKYTYIGAVILGILEIIPMVYNFYRNGLITSGVIYPIIIGISLFFGSCILILLGKWIDKRGIGNGISLILLMNILTTMPSDFLNIYEMYIKNKKLMNITMAISVIIIVILVTLIGTIYLQEGKKEIKTTFSGKISGNKTSKYNESSIPLKVNMSGVMPIIFASSLMQMFPLIVSLCGVSSDSLIYKISRYFSQSNWFNVSDFKYTLGVIPYIILVVFFSYFYNMISFNTNEISRNLASRGGTIKGIRSGKPTEEYLNSQLKYLLLLGSFMLVGIALIPTIISGLFNLSLSFGGTSVLIIASVIIETYRQIMSEKKGNSMKNNYKLF